MKYNTLFDQDESMLEKVEKHSIVYVSNAIDQLFACMLFLAGAYFVTVYAGIIDTYGTLVFIFILLMFWMAFFYSWTQNYFDVWYVTNKNIIAVNQMDLLKQEVAAMEISNIQGLIYEQKGILQAWLGYGKLRIQSKGSEQDLVISDVKNVELIANAIIDLREKSGVKATRGDNRDRRKRRRSVFGFYNICIYTFY